MELPNFQGGGYPMHAVFVTEMIRSLNASKFSAGNLLQHMPWRLVRAAKASVAFGRFGEENDIGIRDKTEALEEEKHEHPPPRRTIEKVGWQCKKNEGNNEDWWCNFLFHKNKTNTSLGSMICLQIHLLGFGALRSLSV